MSKFDRRSFLLGGVAAAGLTAGTAIALPRISGGSSPKDAVSLQSAGVSARVTPSLPHNPFQLLGVGRSLSVLGLVARIRGDLRSAATQCQEALAICRRLGLPRPAGEMLGALTEIYEELGDTEAAAVYRQELATFASA